MLKFFRIYGLSCVVTLLILYLSITTTTERYDGPRFEGMDKVVHFVMYLSLAMAVCRDFFRQSIGFSSLRMYLWAILLPILYGGLIELLQENFFPPRTGEWSDWFADIAGVLVGYFLSRKIYPRIYKL